jgi:hypothetical protein
MAATTAAKFARQLRRLGATVAVRDGCDVIARYHDIEVTARFAPGVDAFDTAWRTGTPGTDTAPIPSMAGVRRALGLPKQPVLTLWWHRAAQRTHPHPATGLVQHRRVRREPPRPAHRRWRPRRDLPTVPVRLAPPMTTRRSTRPGPPPLNSDPARPGRADDPRPTTTHRCPASWPAPPDRHR